MEVFESLIAEQLKAVDRIPVVVGSTREGVSGSHHYASIQGDGYGRGLEGQSWSLSRKN